MLEEGAGNDLTVIGHPDQRQIAGRVGNFAGAEGSPDFAGDGIGSCVNQEFGCRLFETGHDQTHRMGSELRINRPASSDGGHHFLTLEPINRRHIMVHAHYARRIVLQHPPHGHLLVGLPRRIANPKASPFLGR
jgi:hypothetical protein